MHCLLPLMLHFDLNLRIGHVRFIVSFLEFFTNFLSLRRRFRSKGYCTSITNISLLILNNLMLKTTSKHYNLAIFVHFFYCWLLILLLVISVEMIWSFWRIWLFFNFGFLTSYHNRKKGSLLIICLRFLKRIKRRFSGERITNHYFAAWFWKLGS